jgi:hypothetical protein
LTFPKARASTLILHSQKKEEPMPQILVVTDPPEQDVSTVVYRERIVTTDLESDHFSGQLVERVGWAVRDADELERKGSADAYSAAGL